MGMSIMTTAPATEGIQFCIFDLRRGQSEGEELDKILFFFPSECPYSLQLSVVGLCEGMITFTRIFSPDSACEVIEAEKHSYVFYQAEVDIYTVMVLEKNKDMESVWRDSAVRGILKEVHSLFTMFNGSLRALLEKQPTGELARSLLHSFVTDYLTEFQVGKKIQMPSFRECLREWGTVQMLTVSREVAIEVQSLLTAVGSLCDGSTICKSLVLFQDLLVATTLSPDDTVNMFKYAIMRLTPRVLSPGTSSWSYLRKGFSTANAAPASALPDPGCTSDEYQHGSGNTSHGGQSHLARPLQRYKWCKGKDGFVVSDIWGVTPVVQLQQTEEHMYFCVYQHKNLTLVLLIPISSVVDGEHGIALVKKHFLENASQKILFVEEKMSRGWGGENAYHVSGYRYLMIDSDLSISRASPPGKVTTLAKDSLFSLNRLREEVDLEKSRSNTENPYHGTDMEICIRAKNNAWVIAKATRGRELYMALEKADDTLLFASDAIKKFSDRYCDGAFSLD